MELAATVAYRYDNTGGMGEDPAEYPGQRTKITYPDAKTVVYTYEEDGRMSTVTDWDSNVTTYSYGDSGRLESTELPNTVTATYEYDAAGRLIELENADDTPTVLSSYDYTLDAVGNRTQMVDTVGTTTYDYDAVYQLTDVTYPNSDEATYSYDAMGNRLSLDFNESTTEYDYDAANQLTDVDMVSYSYDDNGNLTARGSDTFDWDYEDRMTDAEIDSVDSSYEYNGDGLRVSRTIDTTTVDYYWDVGGGLPVVLQDSDDNSYVYGLDLIARVDDQGDEEYYLYDGLGSTTGLADDTGTVTDTYTYDVFGAIRSQTGSSENEFTYTGEQADGTDLQFLRARYYDPEIGRFLSEDSLPTSQRYAYVGNDPVNYADPSGHCRVEVRARAVSATTFWVPVGLYGWAKVDPFHHLYIYTYDPIDDSEKTFEEVTVKRNDVPLYRPDEPIPIPAPGPGDDIEALREASRQRTITAGIITVASAPGLRKGMSASDASAVVRDDDYSCAPLRASLRTTGDAIEHAMVRYNAVFGPNSNSTVYTLLGAVGLPQVQPMAGWRVPGWGETIGY